MEEVQPLYNKWEISGEFRHKYSPSMHELNAKSKISTTQMLELIKKYNGFKDGKVNYEIIEIIEEFNAKDITLSDPEKINDTPELNALKLLIHDWYVENRENPTVFAKSFLKNTKDEEISALYNNNKPKSEKLEKMIQALPFDRKHTIQTSDFTVNSENMDQVSKLKTFWGNSYYVYSGQMNYSASTYQDMKMRLLLNLLPEKYLARPAYNRLTKRYGYETGTSAAMQKTMNVTLGGFLHQYTKRPTVCIIGVDGHSSAVPMAKISAEYGQEKWLLLEMHPKTAQIVPLLKEFLSSEKDAEISKNLEKLNKKGEELGIYNKVEKPETPIRLTNLPQNYIRGWIDSHTIKKMNDNNTPAAYRGSDYEKTPYSILFTQTEYPEFSLEQSFTQYVNDVEKVAKNNKDILNQAMQKEGFLKSLANGIWVRNNESGEFYNNKGKQNFKTYYEAQEAKRK